ncbi:hypothetical protein [Mycobacterium heckeshornense]|uniref:hypothetical protein n=1 Tax=Mycobacterium heckeshornense TaxID=110505 RepID=UPI001F39CFDE|nr:hypothetical protein [Mycobacterium heckeshornense]
MAVGPAVPPAEADPGDNPCGKTIIPICSLLPIMPDLDHDVDLTVDPHGLDDDAGNDTGPSVGKGNG